MTFKRLFCKHRFLIKEAVFKYGCAIPSEASKGLTRIAVFGDADATNLRACPKTIIKTHFVVSGDRVLLYCKVCQQCGAVRSCDAFDYEDYKKHNEILSSEGL